jgi:hypothetical protein
VIPLDAVTFEVVSTTAHIPFDDDAPIEYSEDVTTHWMTRLGSMVVETLEH